MCCRQAWLEGDVGRTPMATGIRASVVAICLLLGTLQAVSMETAAYTDAISSRKMAAAREMWRQHRKRLLETERDKYRDTELVLTEHNRLAKRRGDAFDYCLPSVDANERTEMSIRGYEVVDIAGSGIEGKVVKCRDADGRAVAVKITERDVHEKVHGMLKTIDSPYVVGTVEHFVCVAGIVSPRFFHVMEYVEGDTLEQRVRSSAARGLDAWRDVVVQLAEALAAVRDAGLCHCDVKAENVVVTSEGGLKLVDFGRAGPAKSDRDDDSLCLAALVFRLLDDDIRDLRWERDADEIVRRSDIDKGLRETLLRLIGGEKCYEKVAACARGA